MGDVSDLNPFKKWKERAKKFLCAGILMLIIGILLFVIGIGLIAKFAEFWGNTAEKLKSGMSYFGVALLILGFVLLAVSIGIFVTLCIVYRRIMGAMQQGPTTQYHLTSYAPGEAPYPQQKGFNYGAMTQVPSGQSPGSTPQKTVPEPGAPAPAPTAPEAHEGDVKIQVSDNYKF